LRQSGTIWLHFPLVENLRIPPDSECRTDGISIDMLREEQISDTSRKTPMSAYFDLRPGVEGNGQVNRILATVVVSASLVEVMLPNGTKRSERTDFSVDCNVQPRIRAR